MILALKTADHTTQLWLLPRIGPGAIASPPAGPDTDWESGRQLSDELLGRITGLMSDHAITFSDLTGIAIFSGPGSFTSLRIGHTVVNALADGLAIPVVSAEGDTWLDDCLEALRTAKVGIPVLPLYGSDAHITRPSA